MSDTRQMISERITVGIDLGDRYSEACLVDPGERLWTTDDCAQPRRIYAAISANEHLLDVLHQLLDDLLSLFQQIIGFFWISFTKVWIRCQYDAGDRFVVAYS